MEDLRAQLSAVDKEIKDLTTQLQEKRFKQSQITDAIAAFSRQQQIDKFEAERFDYSKLDTTDLKNLTLEQLEFIVYDLNGVDAKRRNGAFGYVSMFSRGYNYGDVSFAEYTDTQYRDILTDVIAQSSCRACRQLKHEFRCPKIMCKYCSGLDHIDHDCENTKAIHMWYARHR